MCDDAWWTRAEWARWFIDHDDVDEAARVLEVGDQLALGRSDYLDLAAALQRRGLSAGYELGQVTVQVAAARKGPARTTPAPRTAAKNTA
jgi:hypothetical protein